MRGEATEQPGLRSETASAARIAELKREIKELARERDRVAAQLLVAEQQLADPLGAQVRLRIRTGDELPPIVQSELTRLYRQCESFRRSRSWRYTAPLRSLKHRLTSAPRTTPER